MLAIYFNTTNNSAGAKESKAGTYEAFSLATKISHPHLACCNHWHSPGGAVVAAGLGAWAQRTEVHGVAKPLTTCLSHQDYISSLWQGYSTAVPSVTGGPWLRAVALELDLWRCLSLRGLPETWDMPQMKVEHEHEKGNTGHSPYMESGIWELRWKIWN